MKILFALTICILSLSTFANESSISGTLFKKNEDWNIFVKSEQVAFKKGVLRLTNIPKKYKKILAEKSYVEVIGHEEKCDSNQVCFTVQKIKPTSFDPLKNK